MQNDDPKKVFIFYGPSDEFVKAYDAVSGSNYLTLLQLAAILDKLRIIPDEIKLPDTLVVWPEEFFGVTEGFVGSLWRHVVGSDIKDIYIANPPTHLVEQARLLKFALTEKNFVYPSITVDLIRRSEDELKERIVGQAHATTALARSLTSLINTNEKPTVIMLYGPTGVGKTESAKVIAGVLGGDISRVQFSMFRTSALADYLYGAKVGDRSLASDLMSRHSNIIVFDEFDKTNETFHSAFYQLFDEGLFVDKNYTVDMKNALIICTSNYGSIPEIKQHLGDALSSRITAFIEYKALATEAKVEIVKRKIKEVYDSFPEDVRPAIDLDVLNGKPMVEVLCELANVREITNNIEFAMAGFVLKAATLKAKSDS
jgi:energy-coupling factor transporter ATP-binding protein EcfA2